MEIKRKSCFHPRIMGIVLAAGSSVRMGKNKLLLEVKGAAMVRRTVKALLYRTRLSGLIVVTGYDNLAVEFALQGLPVRFIYNHDYQTGLASSIKAAIRAIDHTYDGALIALGDMPEVTYTEIVRLVRAFNPDEGRSICVPVYGTRRGNPVILASTYFEEILELSGDVGARALFFRYADQVSEVPVASHSVLLDIDTDGALESYRRYYF